MRTVSIVIVLVAGRCRWCQSTSRLGAEWADAGHTICRGCTELDAVMRTPAGRKLIARLVQPLLDSASRERRLKRARTLRRRA